MTPSDSIEDLETDDRVEFELSTRGGVNSAVVTDVLLDPPFPPEDLAEEIGEDQLPGQLVVALRNPETAAKWNLSREIDPNDGLTGDIEAAVKACIDIRHPPRYSWEDRGTVESLEVVGHAE